MSEERHNKIVKINPKTFSTKMMYDIFLDFLQEGEDGWEVVRNKPWPYGAVLKVPNWKEGEYGYAGIMYGQIKGKGKKHSYTVNKKTSYGQWITESKNLQKLAYSTIFPSYEGGYEKEDWRFNNGKIQEWETREQSSSQKRYNFSYGNGVLESDVSAGDTFATVIMSTLTLTGTVKKGTYITIGNKEVVVTKDTSSYTKTYTKPKTDAEGNIVTDNNGNPILVPVTKNCIEIEFSPALEADCPKDTTINLPSKDKQYITVLTERHIATNGYYQIREAEHFYTDADVIWFSMFKQYEPSFDWNELMENTRKNPCAKRLGWSWYSAPYPNWETEAPIYPGEGCPVIASSPDMFSSVTWEGDTVAGGNIEVPIHASPILRWCDDNMNRTLSKRSLFFGPASTTDISNVYVTWVNITIGSEKIFSSYLKNGLIEPISKKLCSSAEEMYAQTKNSIVWYDTTTNAYYPSFYKVEKYQEEFWDIAMQEYVLASAPPYMIIEGEYDRALTPCQFTGYFALEAGGQIFVSKSDKKIHYYYRNPRMITNSNTPWREEEPITLSDALKKEYVVEIDFTKAIELNFDDLKKDGGAISIPYGLYHFPNKGKYLIVLPRKNDNSTEAKIYPGPYEFNSKDMELIIESDWTNHIYDSMYETLVFYKDYDTSDSTSTDTPDSTAPPTSSSPQSVKNHEEYVYLYMSKTKHNANIAVNYREWWDMAQIGFFEPFASDYEYQFPALAMSSNIGARPCNHIVSYGGLPYVYDNMLFDYTQGNRSWGHSMIGYSATWWDGKQEFLDKHACSQTQAMLPSGKWESFFNYGIRSDYWYSYGDSGHYSHGFKEPEKVDSRYFITNTMTPNVEENFSVIPYGIETSGYPFDMTSLDLEIARQNKQSYSLLPFYLGTNIEDNNEQNMICAVPAMYAVSRPVTRYGLYRNPTDKDDLFLIMPNCWEGRPWHYQQDATRLYTNKNKTEEEQQEEYDKFRDWGKNMNVAMHIGTNTSFEQIEDYVAKTKEFD